VDRIKIIATLKWVHDILRELHFTDVLEDIDDCIVMLKQEQHKSISDDFDEKYKAYSNTPEYQAMLAKLKEKDGN
jgi:hypothetical protein